MAAKIRCPACEFSGADRGLAVAGSHLQVLQQDTRIAQVGGVSQRPRACEERPDVLFGGPQVTSPPESSARDFVARSLHRVRIRDVRDERLHQPQPVTQIRPGIPRVGSVPQSFHDLHHFREVPDSPVSVRPLVPQARVPARHLRPAGRRCRSKLRWQMQVSPGDPEHLVIGEQAGDLQAIDHLQGHLVVSRGPSLQIVANTNRNWC